MAININKTKKLIYLSESNHGEHFILWVYKKYTVSYNSATRLNIIVGSYFP